MTVIHALHALMFGQGSNRTIALPLSGKKKYGKTKYPQAIKDQKAATKKLKEQAEEIRIRVDMGIPVTRIDGIFAVKRPMRIKKNFKK